MSSGYMSGEKPSTESSEKITESLLETTSDAEVNPRTSFEEFTDERILISSDAFGKKTDEN